MKKITFARGCKILYLLSISGSLLLVSFLGHTGFSFASNMVEDAPNLSISIPDNSIIMTPTVPVSGTVTGNLQISSMTWNVDNGNVNPIPGFVPSTSIAWSFDISHLSNGLHVLQINATNSAGLVFSKMVSFTLYTDSPVPTASLPNGTYKGFQTVKLETSDPALIFYTLDGTTPTLSSSHGEDSITLPEIRSNTILKFFAVDAYGVKSNVNTQVYIIDDVASSTPVISNTSNTMSSTQKIPIISSYDETMSSTTTSSPIVLPRPSNVVPSSSVLTNSQNMTTNTNSTLSVPVHSNNTISSTPMITQNMTTNTNSTTPVNNYTNSTLNVLTNGTK